MCTGLLKIEVLKSDVIRRSRILSKVQKIELISLNP